MKDSNENLPVVVKQNKLQTKLKNAAVKTAKVLGYSAATMGFIGLTIGSIAVLPGLSIPASVGLAYSAHKLVNNTKYTSYKDLAFVVSKHKDNIKIFQDPIKPDLLSTLKGMTNIEKAGFMQLQAIIGMSKFNNQENREAIKFETDSHGITMKTFKTLNDLGYITNYEETYLQDTHNVIPKLMFGNIKGIKEKEQMYNIKFNLTDKHINLDDEKLKRMFPIVFGKRGILANKPWEIIQNEDGTLSIDYKSKDKIVHRGNSERAELHKSLQKDVPTYEEQKQNSIEFADNKTIDNGEIDRGEL